MAASSMDEALAELAREWLTKALHDLQTAAIVAAAAGGPLDTATNHCQQAAEKAMKGWLAANNIAFEKTHDVRRPIGQAKSNWPEFMRLADAAESLTPYATAYRYPGIGNELVPEREEFDEALANAQSVFDFAVELRPPKARP